jgi:hypothetical protein
MAKMAAPSVDDRDRAHATSGEGVLSA